MANALDIQVLTYTGNGSAGHLIATAQDLTVGAVAVWIFPEATYDPVYRFTNKSLLAGADMVGSQLCFNSVVSTTGGIMAFQSGGFTVTNDVPNNLHVNDNTVTYTALVFRDVSVDSHFLKFGTYTGIGDTTISIQPSLGSTTITSPGNLFNSTLVGALITYATETHVCVGVLGNSVAIMDSPSASSNLVNAIFTQNNRLVLSDSRGLFTVPLTHLWIMGNTVTYCSQEMPVGNSLDFNHNVITLTNAIKALNVSTKGYGSAFKLGTDTSVNANGNTYNWMGLNFSAADLVNNFFQSFKVSGGINPSVALLPFSPTYAAARRFTTQTFGAIWRGPDETGTISIRMSDVANRPTTGITSLVSGVTMNVDLTSVGAGGDPIYGYAMLTGGVPLIAASPITLKTVKNTSIGLIVSPVSPCTQQTATYATVSGPTNGTLSGTYPSITYTPNPGFTGTDSWVYSTSCGGTPQNTTVNVTIVANDATVTCTS